MIGLVEQRDFEDLLKRVEALELHNQGLKNELASYRSRIETLERNSSGLRWDKQIVPTPSYPWTNPPPPTWVTPGTTQIPGCPPAVWCGQKYEVGYAQNSASGDSTQK